VGFCVLCVCVVVLLYWKKIGLSPSACLVSVHVRVIVMDRGLVICTLSFRIHTLLSYLDIPVSGGREELDGDCRLRFESAHFRPETSPEDKNKKKKKRKMKKKLVMAGCNEGATGG